MNKIFTIKHKVNALLLIFSYITCMTFFYAQFIYLYIKPLLYFHQDYSITKINYNENSYINAYNYIKEEINYIPILELNLPLYLTDTFYIKLLLFIILLIIIPLIIITIYYYVTNKTFYFELKEYKFKLIINLLNYIIMYVIIFLILSRLLTLSLSHNNNLLLFEFDIQFNIQVYIYLCIKLSMLIYGFSLIKLNYMKYIRVKSIYIYIVFFILINVYDTIINLFTYITTIFIYFFIYMTHLINIIVLIKFYQSIVKREINSN